MFTLLIEDQSETRIALAAILERKLNCDFIDLTTLATGIEWLEHPPETIDLVVCDYRGSSVALLKCLAETAGKTPCLIYAADAEAKEKLSRELHSLGPRVKVIDRTQAAAQLEAGVDAFLKTGRLKLVATPDAEFVPMGIGILAKSSPISSDLYIRLGPNRYCKLFRKTDTHSPAEVQRYMERKGLQTLYLHRTQSGEISEKHEQRLARLEVEPIDENRARAAVADTLEVISDLVERLGFTPEIQRVSKKAVELTLKVIAKNPGLYSILNRMKLDQGKYITSHSLMLAEISCALAQQVGWQSAPTYLKLTLASFLHDLPLRDHRLARVKNPIELLKAGHLSPEEVRIIQNHPALAADLARKFHEIPPDVDTILAQHHEQPDGKGFPRGLFHKQISPLSSVFIVAHELLHFSLERGETAKIEQFLIENQERYSKAGTFKKIYDALI